VPRLARDSMRGLTGKQIASLHYVVPKCPVAGPSPGGHFGQQRFLRVHIVVDHDLPLGRVEPMKPARILGKGPAPGYRHRKK
jgi:hypothetical protein